jgi:hypothetical protein
MKNLKKLLMGMIALSCAAVFVACDEEDPTLTGDGELIVTTPTGEDTLKMLRKPVAVSASLVYSGEELRLTLANFTDSLMTVVEGGSGVSAGDYTCIVALKDTANYVWSDSTKDTVRIAWKIARATNTKPTATITQHRHTGSLITLALQMVDTAKMTVTNDTATAIGDYLCTISLKDTANQMWSDGTVADVIIAWKITADGKTLLQKPGGGHGHLPYSLEYTERTYTPYPFDPEAMEIIGNNKSVGPGVITYSVALKDTASYACEDGTVADVVVKIVQHYSIPNGDYSFSQITHNGSVLSASDLQSLSAAAFSIYEAVKEKSFKADYGGKIVFNDMRVTYFLDQGWNVVDVLSINADNSMEIWNHDNLEFDATTALVFDNLFFIEDKINFVYTDGAGASFTFVFSLPSE